MTKKVLVLTCLAVMCVVRAASAEDDHNNRAAASAVTVLVSLVTQFSEYGPAAVRLWATILTTPIKADDEHHLIINVSSQTGLFTSSAQHNNATAGTTSTSEDVAIKVRVLVDSNTTGCSPSWHASRPRGSGV